MTATATNWGGPNQASFGYEAVTLSAQQADDRSRQAERTQINSVTALEPQSDVAAGFLILKVRECLQTASDVDFDLGVDNVFRQTLFESIRRFGAPFVDVLSALIMQGQVQPYVAAEALHYLGDIEHPSSFMSRARALSEGIMHRSARVRDGAVLGIMLLDHPIMVPALKRALAKERVPELQGDMQYLLTRLKGQSR